VKTWKFKVRSSGPPDYAPAPTNKPRVAIRLDSKYNITLAYCRDNLKQAEDYIRGDRTELPDPSKIARARFSPTTIGKGRYTGKDRLERGTPFIAAKIHDDSRPLEEGSERYFDPWYFVAMLLLELPAGRFHYDRSKVDRQRGKAYWYLAYIGPFTKEGNHYLRRIIAETSASADTREKKRAKDSHYDYRRATLSPVAKSRVRAMGQETRSLSRTRDDAIKFSIQLFDRQIGKGGKLPRLEIDRSQYEVLLRKAFSLADRITEKLNNASPNANMLMPKKF
jgi:hypothetical protein